MPDIKKLLDTMELIHYLEKYKNKIIILLITGNADIRDIIPDIIILKSFNLKFLIIEGRADKIKSELIERTMEISGLLKKHYLNSFILNASSISINNKKEIQNIDTELLNFVLDKEKIPIISPLAINIRGNYEIIDEKEIALYLMKEIKSDFIFHISETDIISSLDKKYKFLVYEDVKNLIKDNNLDMINKEILEYSIKLMDNGLKEFSVLKCEIGNLYKKVLSYDIAGTLINYINDEKIRNADIEDVNSIYLLIKNESEKNNILPISEEEIEEKINDYMIYEIDNSVVAVGKLNNYGEAAELAKIATYPRYQGGEKAKKLCNQLIEKAKNENYNYIFGLSVNPAMINLFKKLGFIEIERENLPEIWKKNYDFKRPSKAFIKRFKNEKK